MAREKLSEFNTAPDLIDFDYFVGVRDNEDGSYTNYKYTYEQLAAKFARTVVEIGADGDTITDSFIEGGTVGFILTAGFGYVNGIDFEQAGDSITMTNGTTFSTGQKVMLQR